MSTVSKSRLLRPYQYLWICKNLSLKGDLLWRTSSTEKRSHSFSLYFYMFQSMEYLNKIWKVLCFLSAECLSSWTAMGYMAKHLIIIAIGVEENDDNKAFVYVKGCQKREWLADSNDMTIETLDIDYEDIKSLNNLNIINTMRCGKHAKNCTLQNVFKIYNWWSQRQKKLYQFEKNKVCDFFLNTF